jgi:hypothetical protein
MSFTVEILDINFDIKFSGDLILKQHIDDAMDDVVSQCLQILSETLSRLGHSQEKDGRLIKRTIIRTVVKEPVITEEYEIVDLDKTNNKVH